MRKQGKVRLQFLKYIAVVMILIGIMERSYVPVFSLMIKHVFEVENSSQQCSDDPAKELENLKELSEKEYIHQYAMCGFTVPVFKIQIKYPALLKSQFPYFHYPDVPTPPPNV